MGGVGRNPPHPITADEVIHTLRAREAELRRFGIVRMGIFGSVARGDAHPDSDMDLVAELGPAAKVNISILSALRKRSPGCLDVRCGF